RFALLSFSTILCSYAIYYCCKRIMGLRFLNVTHQVESHHTFNFIKDFKDILEQLTYVTAMKELTHVTQSFFKAAFTIPTGATKLYVRKVFSDPNNMIHDHESALTTKVENFIMKHADPAYSIAALLQQSKIFI